MILELVIPRIKPIGLNHSHMLTTIGKHARRIKTTETKVFETKVGLRLDQYQEQINKFNEFYDETKHYLSVDYVFYIPIFTKDKKAINKRGGDCDNFIKPIQDCVFNRLKADDSAITYLTAAKIESENYNIKIIISVRDINSIR